ncbi:hypothetical protein TNCV_4260131 [Trichonephila clavipes]|nr:hypothetical protein TNCV_4260131 [Trichonephila clavipes]
MFIRIVSSKNKAALSSSHIQYPHYKPSRRASTKSASKSSNSSTKLSQKRYPSRRKDILHTEKIFFTLPWILVHVNILGNDRADALDKESRACPQSSNLTTLHRCQCSCQPKTNQQ